MMKQKMKSEICVTFAERAHHGKVKELYLVDSAHDATVGGIVGRQVLALKRWSRDGGWVCRSWR